VNMLKIAGLAGILAATVPAAAHHSTNLDYNVNGQATVTGEFVEFKWINPHAIILFDVTNSQGVKERWAAETHGASVLGRFGWKRDMFKAGDVLTLSGHPARRPEQKSIHVLTVATKDGKSYSVNKPNP
jgi:Family of unknown function (DUF6152)